MTFRDIIEDMNKKYSAVASGALVGSDGLIVEEWRPPENSADLSALCAEIAQFFRESGRIALENGLGEGLEVFLAGDRGCIFIHDVADGYFLAVSTPNDILPGKCRFLLRQAVRLAREIL